MKLNSDKKILIGGGFILLAAAAYACMSTLVKFGDKIPDEQLVFVRNFVCLIVLIPWLVLPKPKSLKTTVFKNHFIRASAGLLNMYCFFYSIPYLTLTDAVLLNNTMPLFIPLIVWIWKREVISMKLIPGLLIGFLGVVVILHPDAVIFRPAALLALASGLFMAISMTGIRELQKIDPPYRILFYYFFISSIISAFPLIWSWQNHPFSLWLILIGVGVFAAIYQFFLTKGYQHAHPAKVSPLIYFSVILSGVFDWIFWHKTPEIASYFGIPLVIVGAIWCIRSEAKKT
ncbi:MAG: DMT family transporter [Chlamydiales bacterium]